jgi:FkbM family methyltransferase
VATSVPLEESAMPTATEPASPVRRVRLGLGPAAAAVCGTDGFWVEGAAGDESVVGLIEKTGCYEPGVGDVIARALRRGGRFVDAGANIGAHALIASHAVGDTGSVLCFEASPTTFRYLEANLRRGGRANVEIFNLGLWDSAATLELSYVPHVAGCSFFATTDVREGRKESVACWPLDDVLPAGSPRTSMVKIDVEGAEMRVLDGAERLLRRDRPDIVIEVNPTTLERFFGAGWRELTARLERLDYAPLIITNAGEALPIASYEDLAPHFERGLPLVNLLCRARGR